MPSTKQDKELPLAVWSMHGDDFWARSSKLEKLPLKPLCCPAHLEPYESIFSPGKVKHEGIGKEHMSVGILSAHGQSFSVKNI